MEKNPAFNFISADKKKSKFAAGKNMNTSLPFLK